MFKKDKYWPAMDPINFEILVKLLSKNHKIIPLNKLSDNLKEKNKLFIITFDDGYKDFFYNVLPIVTKFNLIVNLNICPNLVSTKNLPWTQKINVMLSKKNNYLVQLLNEYNIPIKKTLKNEELFIYICSKVHNLSNYHYNQFIKKLNKIYIYNIDEILDWNEIKKFISQNVIIGCHSHNHLNLNKLGDNQLDKEIIFSKKDIKKNLNIDTEIFSIPNGMIDKKALKIIENNYKYILFSDLNRNPLNITKDNYYINRVNISLNNPYEEYFRSIGFHDLIKRKLNIFFQIKR
tara:strand:- start:1574 stop:2446 length:873 start_codon:yes stop_codon:yes gene_type:complete